MELNFDDLEVGKKYLLRARRGEQRMAGVERFSDNKKAVCIKYWSIAPLPIFEWLTYYEFQSKYKIIDSIGKEELWN
jgi:hypothetical protein